jgi:hypothetical protein
MHNLNSNMNKKAMLNSTYPETIHRSDESVPVDELLYWAKFTELIWIT